MGHLVTRGVIRHPWDRVPSPLRRFFEVMEKIENNEDLIFLQI